MSRRLVSLTLANLDDLVSSCRSCVRWELGERGCPDGAAELAKQAWLTETLLQWGSCGVLLYVDGVAVGHLLYAPPAYVPRSLAFPTSPVGADAVLLMTGQLAAAHRGAGLGRMLVQGVARDVVRRGLKAVEAFGVTGVATVVPGQHPCLLPASFLEAVGFSTVRAHPLTPRLRLEARTTSTWRADVEYAVDRLFAAMQPPAVAR